MRCSIWRSTATLTRRVARSIGEGESRYGAHAVAAGGRGRARSIASMARDVAIALDAQDRTASYGATIRSRTTSSARPMAAASRSAGGRVYVATGYGQVLALDAATGKEIWRQQVTAPVRGAPTVADGRVFAVTVDNELEVALAPMTVISCGRITAFPRPPACSARQPGGRRRHRRRRLYARARSSRCASRTADRSGPTISPPRAARRPVDRSPISAAGRSSTAAASTP